MDELPVAKAKQHADNAASCAALATYVDDCDLDGRKSLRELCWKVIRIFFDSGEPTDVEKFLGL
eukprot:4782741-Alexandrium_andersonii.AAC.1